MYFVITTLNSNAKIQFTSESIMLLKESNNKITFNKSEIAILNEFINSEQLSVIPIELVELSNRIGKCHATTVRSVAALKQAGVLKYVSGYAINMYRLEEVLK